MNSNISRVEEPAEKKLVQIEKPRTSRNGKELPG
jgi:hypothetical protein